LKRCNIKYNIVLPTVYTKGKGKFNPADFKEM